MWGFIKTDNKKIIIRSMGYFIMKNYEINKIIVKFIYLLYYILSKNPIVFIKFIENKIFSENISIL